MKTGNELEFTSVKLRKKKIWLPASTIQFCQMHFLTGKPEDGTEFQQGWVAPLGTNETHFVTPVNEMKNRFVRQQG